MITVTIEEEDLVLDDLTVDVNEDCAMVFAYGLHDPDIFRSLAKGRYLDYFEGLYDEHEDDGVGNLHKRIIDDLTPVVHGYVTAHWVQYQGFSQWEYECTPKSVSQLTSRPGTYIIFNRFEEVQ